MAEPPDSWLRRRARAWFPTREAVHRRRLQMAVFLAGIVCLVIGFELLRYVGPTDLAGNQLVNYGPYGFLLLFLGACLGLIGFGLLATPLEPWSEPAGGRGVEPLPAGLGPERERIAGEARILFIALLLGGLVLLEALPMFGLATSTHLFDRSTCTYNCAALTNAEVAFLLDLIPIAIADTFIAILLFVFIPP